MEAPFVIDLKTPDFDQAPQYVIGSRSFLTDRAVPLPEIIVIPARRWRESRATLRYDGHRAKLDAVGSRRRRLYEATQPVTRVDPGVPVLDIRPIGPNNWSHALNIALPLALMVRDRFREQNLNDPVLICPARLLPKIGEAFEHFGLNYVCTSGRVEGELIEMEPEVPQHQAFVHFRDWITPHAERFRTLIDAGLGDLPKKVFLDRRDGRTLTNGDKVRDFLTERGFETVYPEQLSLAQQFALLCTASEIVAIHGAGIAPLMFRQPDDGPFRFVEILSPGHMTMYFRSFTHGLPADYRAIRGRPTPKLSAAANELSTDVMDYARNFSLSPFELDLTSLELALRPERIDELLWSGEPLQYEEL